MDCTHPASLLPWLRPAPTNPNPCLSPLLFSLIPAPQITRQALKDLESYWLAGGSRPFMTGDSVSVADVLCVCELEQLQ